MFVPCLGAARDRDTPKHGTMRKQATDSLMKASGEYLSKLNRRHGGKMGESRSVMKQRPTRLQKPSTTPDLLGRAKESPGPYEIMGSGKPPVSPLKGFGGGGTPRKHSFNSVSGGKGKLEKRFSSGTS